MIELVWGLIILTYNLTYLDVQLMPLAMVCGVVYVDFLDKSFTVLSKKFGHQTIIRSFQELSDQLSNYYC